TISEGGYITGSSNNLDLDWVQLILSPYSWAVVFLSVVSVLFTLHAKITKQDKKINHLVARYLNPVWEVTNVFFVFFFVGMV
ncbi:hypothetical protein P8629_12540, partial [Hydrogenovibrio sp. 3SP14C1]|uniref:hypothetical protein n=1 Tax=Hydrogenovibrio sp. 3SP14C1 TaxID=3038774 RepID=UPI0024166707